MTIPICAVTGRIAGDADACGDCDPCGAAHMVPDAIKGVLTEKEEWRQKYGTSAAENERLRAALKICAAEWSTPPTTVGEVAGHVGREFVRRMSVAAAALDDEQTPDGRK